MKGDFSRIRLSKKREQEKNYRKVLSQQGRVLTDADWNDYVDIKDNYDTKSLRDIIGKNGIPLEQKDSFKIIPIEGNRYKIGKGRIYVDGILVENFSDVEAFSTDRNMIGQQPYLPTLFNENQQPISEAVPKKLGIYLAYLDVWDRHITYLEDSDIQESALGGPDTTTRVQTVWQVKLHKLKDDEKPISENKWAPWIPLHNDALNNKVFDLRVGTNNNTTNDLSLLEVFALSETREEITGVLITKPRKSRRLESINPVRWETEWHYAQEDPRFKEIEIAFQSVNNLKILHMFGIDNKNNRVFHSTRKDDSPWEDWKELSFSPASAIEVVRNDDGSLELFAFRSTDPEFGEIFHSKQKDFSNDFSEWRPIGGRIPDSNNVRYSAVYNPNNRCIEVYAIADFDLKIWYTRQKEPNSFDWEEWRRINPQQPNSENPNTFLDITVIPDRNGQITIFARQHPKGTIWTTKRIDPTFPDGNGWSKVGNNNVPGDLIKSSLSVNYNKNKNWRLELFGVFSDSEIPPESGNVWNISENKDGSWNSEWKAIKGLKATRVYTSALMKPRLDIFAIEAETGIVHHSYDQDTTDDWCNLPIPSWDSKIESSSGQIQARTRPQELPSDPCMLPEGAGYRRLENQLYRIEIHEPKSNGKNATFKYSRDNGIVCSKIIDISTAEKITVESTGRDGLLGFDIGQWIEITDDLHELWGVPGVLVRIKDVEDTDLILDSNTLIPSGAAINYVSFPARFNPKVRRWDTPPGLDSPASLEVEIPTENDGFIKIEDGIEIKFGSIDNNVVYRTGDYWTIPARTLKADIEWPKRNDATPEFMIAEGIHHHYVKLAFLKFTNSGILELISDCRDFFPPLNTLDDLSQQPIPVGTKPDLMLTNGMAFKYIDEIGEINKISVNKEAKKFMVNADARTIWYIVNAGPRESITFQIIGTMLTKVDDPQRKDIASIDIAPGCGFILDTTFIFTGLHVGMDYNTDHFMKGGCFYVIANEGENQHPDKASELHKPPHIESPEGRRTYKLTLTAVTRPVKISPDNVFTPNGIIYNCTFFVGSYEDPLGQTILLNDSPPGPAIKLKRDSKLELTLKNETKVIQGISFQGLHLNEGSMIIVRPGESKTSTLSFSNPGIFIYYGIGDAFNGIGNRINDGMFGAIAVVEDPDNPGSPIEYCVVFSDFNLPQ